MKQLKFKSKNHGFKPNPSGQTYSQIMQLFAKTFFYSIQPITYTGVGKKTSTKYLIYTWKNKMNKEINEYN